MSWMDAPWMANRWMMDINYVPVTIGADDGTPYEEIYPTIADWKATWGIMDQNYVVYFSDPSDYLEADDPILNPWNQDAVYYMQTKIKGVAPAIGLLRTNLKLNLALEL